MTRLGFLLDSDSCIGCHACTVACKSEHDVPIGVNRTWVKYIETGAFPNVARHFTVMRCNQCEDAPCMTICPTSALHRTDNGVVDFDDSLCIGCKGCMNACPYDAIYINPESNTAHKCNFCNHRLEVGLEPSCVVVCPTEAIKVADLDDPNNAATKIIGRQDVAVRTPEQGTNPKVYYRGADQAALDPLRTAIASDGLIWADTTPGHSTPPVGLDDHLDRGLVGRTTYTTPKQFTWGSMVSGYLVTKAIAAGVMMVASLFALMGYGDDYQAAVGVVPPIVAGAFLGITGVLLVADLKQPKRFYYLLIKGNQSSWLVKGAYALLIFGLLIAAWWVVGLIGELGVVLAVLAVPMLLAAAGAAGYTAFLFGQCEGRDLWQTPLLLPILLAQAVVAGAASFSILGLFMDLPNVAAVNWMFLAGLGLLAVLIYAELAAKGSRHVEYALAVMTKGPKRGAFWLSILGGLVAPATLVTMSLLTDVGAVPAAVAGVLALGGMFLYEDAYVEAGQSVPLS